MKALRQILERVREHRDQSWALATLVETRGSTYRKPGARMLVDANGGTTGVLSGGCLEDEIARKAINVIRGDEPVLLEFDTRRLYGCDGNLRIFLERVPPAGVHGNILTDLSACLERRQLCRLSTCYEGTPPGTRLLSPVELVPQRPGTFLQCVPLPIRLLLFGAGPEISPIREFAQTLGWVTHHFTHASEAPDDLQFDQQTAALIMTHNFGRDLAALHSILPLGLPYIGLLGPRKRHQQLLAELFSHHPPESTSMAAIHAPAGLDIGSEAPEEIALSIVSEVAAVLAARQGGHLRDRTTAIHIAEMADTKRVA
jgi:xanthine/CO dehydrogenase XdhC/CoxF family maturation factor